MEQNKNLTPDTQKFDSKNDNFQSETKNLSIEDKQIILLNRTYVNIEGWKSYRIKIPTAICLSMFALASFFVKEIGGDKLIKIFAIGMIVTIGVFGCIFLAYVISIYNHLVRQILHIYDKIGIKGEDFYIKDKDPQNSQRKVNQFFYLGLVAIVITCIFCTFILFKYNI